jgi:hypothetical protein
VVARAAKFSDMDSIRVGRLCNHGVVAHKTKLPDQRREQRSRSITGGGLVDCMAAWTNVLRDP